MKLDTLRTTLLFSCLILQAIFALFSPPLVTGADAVSHYNNGVALMEKFRYGEAVAAFREALNLLHDGSDLGRKAQDLINECVAREEEFREQVRHKNLNEANKKRLRELLIRANEEFLKRNFRASRELFEVVIDHLQLEPEIHFNYGLTCLELGDVERARGAFLKALELKPRYREPLLRLLTLTKEAGGIAPLMVPLQREIQSGEEDLKKWRGEAEESEKQGYYDAATEYRERIRANELEMALLYFFRGKGEFQASRFDTAIATLRRATELNPNEAEIHILLGRCFGKKKLLLSSSQSFERALRLFGAEYELRIKKANDLFEQGENEAGEAQGKEAVRVKEKMGMVYYLLGRVLYVRELTKPAIAMLEKSVDFHPELPDAGFLLSQILARDGEVQRAIGIIQTILKSAKPGSETARMGMNNLKILLNFAESGGKIDLAADGSDGGSSEPPTDGDRGPLKDFPIPGARAMEQDLLPVADRLRSALELESKGDFPAAEKGYLDIIHRDGSVREAFIGLSRIANGRKDLERELFFLEKSLAMDPRHPETLYLLSQSLLANDTQLERALEITRDLIKVESKNPHYLHGFGWSLFKNGFIEESIIQFQKALFFDPQLTVASFNLATARYLNSEFSESAKLFEKLTTDNKWGDRAHLFLGLIAMQQQKLKEAGDHFKKVQVAKKETVLAKYLDKILKKLDQAIALKKGVAPMAVFRPNDTEKHLVTAREQFRRGLYPRAVETLTFALKKDPGSFEALRLMGEIYFAESFFPRAAEFFESAIRVNGTDFDTLLALGKCYYKQANLKGAVTYFTRALAVRHEDPEAHYYLGLVKFNVGDRPAASLALSRSIALAPDFGKAHLIFGVLLFSEKKYQEARNHFFKAYHSANGGAQVKSMSARKLREVESLMAREKIGPYAKTLAVVEEHQRQQKDVSDRDWRTMNDRFARAGSGPLEVKSPWPPKKSDIQREIALFKKLDNLNLGERNYRFYPAKPAILKEPAPTPSRPVDPADPLVREGNAKAITGQLEEAIADYESAYKKSPTNGENLFNRGFLWTLLLKYGSAFHSIQEMLQNSGREGLAYNALGNLLWLSGDGVMAIRSWRAANRYPLTLDPPNVLPEYRSAWESVLKSNPEDEDILLNLAIVELFGDGDKKADRYLDTILKNDGYRNDVKFYSGMAKVKNFLREGDFFLLNKALRQYNEILGLDPDFPQVKKLLFVMSDLKSQIPK